MMMIIKIINSDNDLRVVGPCFPGLDAIRQAGIAQ